MPVFHIARAAFPVIVRTAALCGVQGREHRAPGLFFMIENSPLSGEFQKGEAYSCQKEALLCYKKVVLTSVVAKESDNG